MKTLQLLSAGPRRQASARTSAESDEACQRKTKDRADGMREKVPIPLDGIRTCTSGIRAHRASDYTTRVKAASRQSKQTPQGGLYPRGVIGSTVGAYPRGTGSNPVEGNGHFFPSYRQLYLSSFLRHASSDSAEVLADAWRRGPADRSWSVSCMFVLRWSWRVSV